MISLDRYRVLLGEPSLAGAFAASMAGRLPIGMAVLAILLFIQHTQQSFSAAGIAAALYVTGLILALASVGSAVGALVYGSRSWSLAPTGQYKAALLAMCLGLALLAPVRDLVLFGAIAIVAGVPMATVLAAQSVLIAGIAPRAALAEAFTWASTSLLAGVSVGIGLGGLLLEVATPMLTLFGASLTTTAALATACLSVHSGRPDDDDAKRARP
ncbi:MAG: hypothetical protein GEV05_28865 [Betaproteobacteria bacterium]|nr:hypothetical protein [Betaproteobacteria bacterium]